MSGPWELYQNAEPQQQTGPWDLYKAPPEPPGIMSKIGDAAVSAGKAGVGLLQSAGHKLDQYLGAPVRTVVGAAQDGEADPIAYSLSRYGQDPSLAPTVKELALKAGLDDKHHLSEIIPGAYMDRNAQTSFWDPRVQKGGMLDPSAADAGGAALGLATDPLTYVPGGEIARGAKALAETKAGSKAVGLLAKGGIKLGNALTGVGEKEIETYGKYGPEVKAMSKSSANDVGEAANTVSSKMTTDIQSTKQSLNNQISQTLGKMPKDPTIDASPIFDAIDSQKSKINARLNPEKLEELDAIKDKIKRVTDEKNMMSVQDANDVKTDLQEMAQGAYKKNGQIFQVGRDAQQAAKLGAAQARKLVNAVAPEVAEANNQLAKLHAVDKSMNKNLLVEDKSAPGLIAAGTGGNTRNVKSLKRIGEITKTEPLQEAEKLAAMRTFGSPPWMPADSTGKAVGRMGLGAGLGYLIGHVPGAFVGSAMTSPMALRTVMDAGRLAGKSTKYAEPTGLLLEQLSHQGLLPTENNPPGFLPQTLKKKDQDRTANR